MALKATVDVDASLIAAGSRGPFTNAAKRAQFMIDRHREVTGLEGDAEIILIHILGDLMQWCDERSSQGYAGPNFERTVAAAREMLRDCDG